MDPGCLRALRQLTNSGPGRARRHCEYLPHPGVHHTVCCVGCKHAACVDTTAHVLTLRLANRELTVRKPRCAPEDVCFAP
eukprot:scaffold26539_cov62-Phaeocystis_antarctica.AAC.1